MRLRKRVGHEGCARDGTCANRRAQQERAARFIMFGHGSFLPSSFFKTGGAAQDRICRTIIVWATSAARFACDPVSRPCAATTLPPDEPSSRKHAGLAT
jgi:hypothetical protein